MNNRSISDENFNKITDHIREMIDEISETSIITYDQLPKYDLFLSQVKDFLNDKFKYDNFTNNILQNYIKGEVVSKPEDSKKRGYTKIHLIELILLANMRPVLTTEEIREVFRLAFNDINNRSDDILGWEDTYKLFNYLQKESLKENFINFNEQEKEKIFEYLNQYDFDNDEKERIVVFLIVISLVAQASNIKKLIGMIVDEYGNKYK